MAELTEISLFTDDNSATNSVVYKVITKAGSVFDVYHGQSSPYTALETPDKAPWTVVSSYMDSR